jgi:hypothetical protein
MTCGRPRVLSQIVTARNALKVRGAILFPSQLRFKLIEKEVL